MPKVTVAMPSYNSAEHIGVAIESLLKQTFRDFVLLISDNASSDGCFEIAADYAKCDDRIILTRQRQNIGAAANFAHLLKGAESPYFMWASSHDCWSDNYLHVLHSLLERNRHAVLSYANCCRLSASGVLIQNIGSDNFECLESRPDERAKKLVKSLQSCHMIYGLMRTRELNSSRHMLRCIGPDHVILAEMSLRGQFVYSPDAVLFLRVVREEPTDELEFRRSQLIRLLGTKDVEKQLASRYRDWWWEHVRSGFAAPGFPVCRLRNVAAISSAFVSRWQPMLPSYISQPYNLYNRAKRGLWSMVCALRHSESC